ncbi:MAG: hypothetical protein IPG06_05675 [Haliea sp.]|nr:hypothetical protein [Haliea sp.]
MNYCPDCGGPLLRHVVGGELRNHWFCLRCQAEHHVYPRVVVTAFVACGKRLLMGATRARPAARQVGYSRWFPGTRGDAGRGTARELYEEAGVRLPPARLQLYMTGSITFINQVYMGFRATVEDEACLPGVESMDCRFFARDECPWEALAYPQVNDSIRQAYDDLDSGDFAVWQAQMTQSHYELRPVSQGRAESKKTPR